MKITADTDLLVRVLMGDDKKQSRLAQAALADAELVALAVPALCELVWVLSQGYKVPAPDIIEAIQILINAENAVTNRAAVEAGLTVLASGGDFADGVIAYEGQWLGADTFLSFDKRAVKLIEANGGLAKLLG